MSTSAGTKSVGQSLNKQEIVIKETNENLNKAKNIISKLKSTNTEYMQMITNLTNQLKETKSRLAKGDFKNAGEKVITANKCKRLEGAIKEIKARAVQINKELEKYKKQEAIYEQKLNTISGIIRQNTDKLASVNTDLSKMINNTSMRFNMRSSSRKSKSKRKRTINKRCKKGHTRTSPKTGRKLKKCIKKNTVKRRRRKTRR